jgi:hypothetical protein
MSSKCARLAALPHSSGKTLAGSAVQLGPLPLEVPAVIARGSVQRGLFPWATGVLFTSNFLPPLHSVVPGLHPGTVALESLILRGSRFNVEGVARIS